MMTKGTMANHKKEEERYELLVKRHQMLLENLTTLSKHLHLDLPVQAREEKVRMFTGKIKEDDINKIDLFSTSEERKIYGKLPDLTKSVPGFLLALEKEKVHEGSRSSKSEFQEDPGMIS